MEYTITVLPQNQTLTVARGSNLLSALVKAGLAPEAPCGGNGKCGKCTVTVNGEPTLACRYRVESDLTVALPAKFADAILSQAHAGAVTPDPLGPGYPVAVDIGTTTVVCYLLSPEGQELAVASMRNPQAPFGADVISRIRKALEGKLEALTGCIRAGVSQLILDCCRQAGIAPDQIGVVSIVGNPCMQQLFLGIAPQNLAAIPFAPVLTRAEILPAGACLPPAPRHCCSPSRISPATWVPTPWAAFWPQSCTGPKKRSFLWTSAPTEKWCWPTGGRWLPAPPPPGLPWRAPTSGLGCGALPVPSTMCGRRTASCAAVSSGRSRPPAFAAAASLTPLRCCWIRA